MFLIYVSNTWRNYRNKFFDCKLVLLPVTEQIKSNITTENKNKGIMLTTEKSVTSDVIKCVIIKIVT